MTTPQQNHASRSPSGLPYKPTTHTVTPFQRWPRSAKPTGMSRDELRAIVAEQLG